MPEMKILHLLDLSTAEARDLRLELPPDGQRSRVGVKAGLALSVFLILTRVRRDSGRQGA